MTCGLDLNRSLKNASDLPDATVNTARTERLSHVKFIVVKETQMEFTVGSEPHPIAGAAIGLTDRANKANDPSRIRYSIIAGFVGRVIRLQLTHSSERGLDAPAGFDIGDVALD